MAFFYFGVSAMVGFELDGVAVAVGDRPGGAEDDQ